MPQKHRTSLPRRPRDDAEASVRTNAPVPRFTALFPALPPPLVGEEMKLNTLIGGTRDLVRGLLQRARPKYLMTLSNDARIRALRREGVRIGEGCLIQTTSFSSEPYLVDIGDHVAISSGTCFITHDAAGWVFRDHPDMEYFGRIRVGNNTYFGTYCTILPGAQIGSNCVIGSGSVVRGDIRGDSVVFGNPARVVMRTPLLKQMLVKHVNRFDTLRVTPREREDILRRHFGLP